MITRYGIQRKSDGAWLGIEVNSWVEAPIAARWFDSMTEAELAGARELSGSVLVWQAQPIPRSWLDDAPVEAQR